MSNYLSLINDALTLIGVLPEGQDATSEQATLALRTANELVGEWADDNLIVSWDSNADLANDLSLTGVELTAVKYMLAVTLCPMFGREPPSFLAALAGESYRKLQRIQLARSIAISNAILPRAQMRGGYDILTDDTL